MTSLFHAGSNEASGATTLYPIDLQVTATPITNETYTIAVTFSINA